jgi:hypothetical protein
LSNVAETQRAIGEFFSNGLRHQVAFGLQFVCLLLMLSEPREP